VGLYDICNDLSEFNNLAYTKEGKVMVEQLYQELLKELEDSVGGGGGGGSSSSSSSSGGGGGGGSSSSKYGLD